MRRIFLATSFVALGLAGGCTAPRPNSVWVNQLQAALCARQPLSYWNVAAGLNRFHQFCEAQPFCRGGYSNTTVVDVAAYSNGWLWSGASSHVFTIAEQDALMVQARAKAQAARPAGTVISNIEYLHDFLVSTGGGYFIGARASYSTCSHTLPT